MKNIFKQRTEEIVQVTQNNYDELITLIKLLKEKHSIEKFTCTIDTETDGGQELTNCFHIEFNGVEHYDRWDMEEYYDVDDPKLLEQDSLPNLIYKVLDCLEFLYDGVDDHKIDFNLKDILESC